MGNRSTDIFCFLLNNMDFCTVSLLLLVLLLLVHGRQRDFQFGEVIQKFPSYQDFNEIYPLMGGKERKYESSYSVWKGKLVYFRGVMEVSLTDANEICGSMNGKLPSVHSKEDALAIEQIMGHDARAWLGGKNLSSEDSNNFKWIDGTSWDYDLFPTGEHRTPCSSHCCGIGYTTVSPYETGFVIKNCADERRMICVIDDITEMMDQMFPDDNGLNQTLQQQEEKLALLTAFNVGAMEDSLTFLSIFKNNIINTVREAHAQVALLAKRVDFMTEQHTTQTGLLIHHTESNAIDAMNLEAEIANAKKSFTRAFDRLRPARGFIPNPRISDLQDKSLMLASWTKSCFLLLIAILFIVVTEVVYRVYASRGKRFSLAYSKTP